MVKIKGKVAQHIYDATWYQLRRLAAYKAEVVLVNPGFTTQACSKCGFILDEKIGLDMMMMMMMKM
jgi:transposase